jgi:hypothetical protein
MWFKEVEQDNGIVTTVPCGVDDRPVERWKTVTTVGPMRVSTVFLGLDHWGMLYETMVFEGDGSSDFECERYATRAEAIEGHKVVVARWESLVAAKIDG